MNLFKETVGFLRNANIVIYPVSDPDEENWSNAANLSRAFERFLAKD